MLVIWTQTDLVHVGAERKLAQVPWFICWYPPAAVLWLGGASGNRPPSGQHGGQCSDLSCTSVYRNVKVCPSYVIHFLGKLSYIHQHLPFVLVLYATIQNFEAFAPVSSLLPGILSEQARGTLWKTGVTLGRPGRAGKET